MRVSQIINLIIRLQLQAVSNSTRQYLKEKANEVILCVLVLIFVFSPQASSYGVTSTKKARRA